MTVGSRDMRLRPHEPLSAQPGRAGVLSSPHLKARQQGGRESAAQPKPHWQEEMTSQITRQICAALPFLFCQGLSGLGDAHLPGESTGSDANLFRKHFHRYYQNCFGNSLAVRWLGLGAATARGPSSIPARKTKILQSMRHGQEEKKVFIKRKEKRCFTSSVGS